MNEEIEPTIKKVQARVAAGAITPSAVRGKGSKTVLRQARDYLARVPLTQFSVPTETKFRAVLSYQTSRLLQTFPKRARKWGLARKCLNLFLRDALYNYYLNPAFNLGLIESFLEIPLDSRVAKSLNHLAGRGKLPRWLGVRALESNVSKKFQGFARKHAQDRQHPFARVHLDNDFWLRPSHPKKRKRRGTRNRR